MAKSTLIRKVTVGESLSFDGGRIVLVLEDKSGRRASLRLTLHEDVVVDKPRVAANEPMLGASADTYYRT